MSDSVTVSLTVYDESVSVLSDLHSHSLHCSTHYDRSRAPFRKHVQAFEAATASDPPEGSLRFGDQNLNFQLTLEPSPQPNLFESVVRIEIHDVSFRVQFKAFTTPRQARDFARSLARGLEEEDAFPAVLQFVPA